MTGNIDKSRNNTNKMMMSQKEGIAEDSNNFMKFAKSLQG